MKKVLMISYYAPPLGTGGIHRVFKFAKYLPRFGWEGIILSVKPITYYSYDYEALREAPSIKILRAESLDPSRISYFLFKKKKGVAIYATKTKLSRAVRLLTLIDSKTPWIPFASLLGRKAVRSFKPLLIFSSAPPISCHLVGLYLKKTFKIPLVTDFRDPFIDIYQPPTPFQRFLQLKSLRYIEKSSDLIVTVSQAVKERLLLPRAIVIENGYDPETLEIQNDKKEEGFTIGYTGSLLQREYSLIPFIEALKEMENVKLKIAGRMSDSFKEKIKELKDKVEFLGFLSHKESIKLMKSCDLLWVTVEREWATTAVPSKLFEYIGVGKPIIATVPEESEVARYIRDWKLGVVAQPEKEEIKKAIKRVVKENIHPSKEAIKYFNKIEQTKRLASLFDSLI